MRSTLRAVLTRPRTRSVAAATVLAVTASTVGLLAGSATAGTAPWVQAMSTHRAAYWGGTSVTVYGANFTGITKVNFGATPAWSVRVLSSTRLVAISPYHRRGKVNVRVSSRTGTSSKNSASALTFSSPTMNDKIQGGLTGKQEQRLSRQVRARHHTPGTAHRSKRWTAAMGLTAARRATSWLGLPYSWAGGNSRGPTKGVCAGDGGDVDCKIVGFDCSGLTLYSWAPYKGMAHYAATQRRTAGRFHPGVGELVPGDLVFFSGYIPNGVGHVAIYVGNGYVVQAEQSGSTVKRDRLTDVIASHGTYRGATRPTSTGQQGAAPKVSSVTPTVRSSGGLVTITGRNLTSTTSVSVSGKRYYSFISRSSSRLVVRVPAHAAGKGSISVSNAWGTVKRATTYVAPPSISSLSPASGPVAGGNTVIVHGRNLGTVSRVVVGAASVSVQRLSTTSVRLVMPAHASGVVPVTLVSNYGNSARRYYVYVAPVPSSTPAPSPTTAKGSATTPKPAPSTSASTSASTKPPTTATPPTTPSAPTTPTTPSVPSTTATTSAPTTAAPSSSTTAPAGSAGGR